MRSIWNWLKHLKYGSFFGKVLVVVISVSLSMAVGRWIEERKRESNIKVSLSLVRDELHANQLFADSVAVTLRKNKQGFRFLSAHRGAIRQVEPDTLMHYLRQTTISRRGTMSHYAMEVLKSSAAYEELDNALLIYLSRAYGLCAMYSGTMDRFFEQTRQVFDESVTQLYETHSPSAYEVFGVLMDIPVFRARLYNASLVRNVLNDSEALSGELEQYIMVLDSLLKNDGYKKFKIDPTVDHIGSL